MRSPKRSLADLTILLVLAGAAGGCAAKRFSVPTNPGVPLNDHATAWMAAAGPCLGVRTLTAELALSGKAGDTRMRGRVQAGFEAPGRIRLEGVAPFGQPVFILAGDGARATLLLPRDERVVTAAGAAEILEALAGVRLDADTLRAVLTGCVFNGAPTGATGHDAIVRFSFADGAAYVERRGNASRIVAAETQSFLIEYPDAFAGGSVFPRRARISRASSAGHAVDLTITVSQIETNISLPPAAFTIEVPPGTKPITLAELRAAGPLGTRN